MTDTNQKLREALQAISHIDDTTNHSVDASAALDRIGQIARQALALPPDVPETTFRGMREALQLIAWSNDSKWQADCARQALALPTADHLPDAGEMVVDHFPDATKMIETAAPVCEREAFEREMSKPPFEFCMDRWPDDGSYAWPGNYAAYHTQCAWAAWQARAALSAGDAVAREGFQRTTESIRGHLDTIKRREELCQ